MEDSGSLVKQAGEIFLYLIVKNRHNTGIVFVRFIGSHAQYDKVDATSI